MAWGARVPLLVSSLCWASRGRARHGLVLRMLADAETARVASAPARIAVPEDALGHSPASRQRNQNALVGNQRSPAKAAAKAVGRHSRQPQTPSARVRSETFEAPPALLCSDQGGLPIDRGQQ